MDFVEHRPIYLQLCTIFNYRDTSFDSSNLFITRLLILCFANKWALIAEAFLQRRLKASFLQ